MKAEKPKAKINKNKVAKRKVRNKKRKKRKQEERKQLWVPANKITTTTQTNERIERSQQTHRKEVNSMEPCQIWHRTYENAVRWVCAHQVNYWREKCAAMQEENEKLRNELNQLRHNAGVEHQEQYVTSSSSSSSSSYVTSDEEDEEMTLPDAEVDEGYLNFIQITHKHREELRQQREKKLKENNNK